MITDEIVRYTNDLDVRWPLVSLLDILGFRSKVRGRVEDYLAERGIEELSLRELMDLFLPSAYQPIVDLSDFYRHIPILRQPQFGPYLYDSALLTLTEAEMGSAFSTEWASRVCRLKLFELRDAPANRRFYKLERKRSSR